jgi:hypothetical protein
MSKAATISLGKPGRGRPAVSVGERKTHIIIGPQIAVKISIITIANYRR